MQRLLADLQGHPQAWAFLNPVPAEDVADYYEVIKKPMGTFLVPDGCRGPGLRFLILLQTWVQWKINYSPTSTVPWMPS